MLAYRLAGLSALGAHYLVQVAAKTNIWHTIADSTGERRAARLATEPRGADEGRPVQGNRGIARVDSLRRHPGVTGTRRADREPQDRDRPAAFIDQGGQSENIMY
jgi:hypothetical protein